MQSPVHGGIAGAAGTAVLDAVTYATIITLERSE